MKKLFFLLVMLFTFLCTASAYANERKDFYKNAKSTFKVITQNNSNIFYMEGNKIYRYSVGDGKHDIIAEISDLTASEQPKVHNGYILYANNWKFYLYNTLTGENTEMGPLKYGTFGYGEGKVAYIEPNGKTNPLVSVNLSTKEKTTVIPHIEEYNYITLKEFVGDDLYYNGKSAALGDYAFLKTNIKTKATTVVNKKTMDSFYYDKPSNVIYVSNREGVQKFKPLSTQFYWVRRAPKLSFTELGSEYYEIMRVSGKNVYLKATTSFMYTFYDADAPKGFDSTVNIITIACADSGSTSFKHLTPYNMNAIKDAYGTGNVLEAEKNMSVTIVQEDSAGAYYFYQDTLYRIIYGSSPVPVSLGTAK